MTLPNSRGKSAFWSFLQRSPRFPTPHENDGAALVLGQLRAGSPGQVVLTSASPFPTYGTGSWRPSAKPIHRDAQLARPAASSSGMNRPRAGTEERAGPGATRSPPHPGARPPWWPEPGPHRSGAAPAAASGSVPAASRGGEMQMSQRIPQRRVAPAQPPPRLGAQALAATA